MKISLTPKLSYQVLLCLALLATLSGCGKSKELSTPQPTTPVATQQEAPPVNSGPTKEAAKDVPEINSNPDNELLPDDGKNKANGTGIGAVKPKDNSTLTEEETTIASDFSQAAAKTGGQVKDLFYTGAGSDGLMNEFKSYGLKVSKEQQQMNANLAKAISSARLGSLGSLITDEKIMDLIIDETVNGSGGLKSYRLKAKKDGNKMILSSLSAGGNLQFQGGFLKCLDKDGGCLAAYAKIKFSGAYTRVIFRNSYTHVSFSTQKNVSNNRAFDGMKEYLNNASNGVSTNQKLDSIEVASFEITNGRAAMGAMLTTVDQQMIGLQIPLLVSGVNSDINTVVTRSSDLAKSFSLPSGKNYSQQLAQSISEVRLVNNNGRGHVKLQFSFSNNLIWITLSPVKKATLSLEEVRQFESTVKSF